MLQASNRLRRRAVAPLLSALVVALALAGCGGADAPAAGPGAGMPPAVVTTRTVEMQPWVDVIEALGTAQARESLTITAKVTETVDSVKFEDGDRVAAGDILVDLSGRAEVANLEEAQATFKEARQQYERLVGLVENGTVPRSQLDTQVAARDAARARVETIRARLADPPFDSRYPSRGSRCSWCGAHAHRGRRGSRALRQTSPPRSARDSRGTGRCRANDGSTSPSSPPFARITSAGAPRRCGSGSGRRGPAGRSEAPARAPSTWPSPCARSRRGSSSCPAPARR